MNMYETLIYNIDVMWEVSYKYKKSGNYIYLVHNWV